MQQVSSVELLHHIQQQWREGSALDLSGVHCTTQGFSLAMADGSPVDISQGNYAAFGIEKASFSNVNFQSSEMQGARFHRCTFFDCDFSYIEGEAITFTECLFVNATFYAAHLIVANLSESRFYCVNFDQANLYGAHLIGTRICGPFPLEIVTQMVEAVTIKGNNPFTLPQSTAKNTNMLSLVAQHAVLCLDLTSTVLLGADLTGANLLGSGLVRETLLNKATIEGAIFTQEAADFAKQIRLFSAFWDKEVGNALVTDLVDGETEQSVTPREFFTMVAPYVQRAKDERLELVFHVFTSGANRWISHIAEAWEVYQGWVAKKQPSRLWVELYCDRANNKKAHEDCLLSYGDFPF